MGRCQGLMNVYCILNLNISINIDSLDRGQKWVPDLLTIKSTAVCNKWQIPYKLFSIFIYIYANRVKSKLEILQNYYKYVNLGSTSYIVDGLYISSKEPVPWSCRVRGIFTKGDRITIMDLNSLSSLRHTINSLNLDIWKHGRLFLPSLQTF